MYELLPINYIYQTNARFNVFIFQFETENMFITKIFKEQALKVALLLCNDYESCQAIAYIEQLSKCKLWKRKHTM